MAYTLLVWRNLGSHLSYLGKNDCRYHAATLAGKGQQPRSGERWRGFGSYTIVAGARCQPLWVARRVAIGRFDQHDCRSTVVAARTSPISLGRKFKSAIPWQYFRQCGIAAGAPQALIFN
jgi:hypothetical protein